MAGDPAMAETVHPAFELTRAEIVWACREEMARTVDDVLARRSRSLIFDARAALEAAPAVAEIMREELERDEAWVESTLRDFRQVADAHIWTG